MATQPIIKLQLPPEDIQVLMAGLNELRKRVADPVAQRMAQQVQPQYDALNKKNAERAEAEKPEANRATRRRAARIEKKSTKKVGKK